jgi:hypothetical protein
MASQTRDLKTISIDELLLNRGTQHSVTLH